MQAEICSEFFLGGEGRIFEVIKHNTIEIMIAHLIELEP